MGGIVFVALFTLVTVGGLLWGEKWLGDRLWYRALIVIALSYGFWNLSVVILWTITRLA